ncbi:MAG: 16S rRNA (guanine(527)-N(7))-methyltransferase RsmG [Candidatus Dormibacteria bacterium]|jgi:16S rRNA (guanine527-N7)-methyltransferase
MERKSEVELDQQTRRRLETYLELLYLAGDTRNLTRVARDKAWERHIEESLSLVPLRPWRSGELVVDLGSGGGVPGIPLALLMPQVRFVLVERTQSKAAFLRSCVSELGLSAVTVEAREALELGRDPAHPRADVVVSRAAAPLPRLLPLVSPLLRPGGEAILVVGSSVHGSADLASTCARAHLGTPKIVDPGRIRVLRVRRR